MALEAARLRRSNGIKGKMQYPAFTLNNVEVGATATNILGTLLGEGGNGLLRALKVDTGVAAVNMHGV